MKNGRDLKRDTCKFAGVLFYSDDRPLDIKGIRKMLDDLLNH